MSGDTTVDLRTHLQRFGIQHFESPDEYWRWGRQVLGRETSRRLNRLRRPLESGASTKRDRHRFYDFIAEPVVAAVVHSMKADAIRASGEAVAARIADRKSVLDLGSSIGYLTTWYATVVPGRRVVGIDSSEESIRAAQEWTAQLAVPHPEFLCINLDKAIPAENFDAVVDTQTSDYVSDPNGLFSRVSAALADDGILVSVPALGIPAAAGQFVGMLQDHDLLVTSLEFIYFSDLGGSSAYPVITAARSGKHLTIDFEGEYERVLRRLRDLQQEATDKWYDASEAE